MCLRLFFVNHFFTVHINSQSIYSCLVPTFLNIVYIISFQKKKKQKNDSDILFFFHFSDKLMDSDGSKEDSSVDSGTETSRSLYPEVRRESLIIPKKVSLPTREAMDNYLEQLFGS